MCHMLYSQTRKRKKNMFLLPGKYLLRNRSLVYKFLHPPSLIDFLNFDKVVIPFSIFFFFSSKRHQPMPWSLYTFKYTIRVLNARETFEEKHRLHRALLSLNISKSIYLLLLCIKCATHAIIMQYQ